MQGAQNSLALAKVPRALILGLGILGLVWMVTGWILEKSSSSLMLAGLAFLGIAIVVAVLNNWRSGFYLFLIWLLFEDLVDRKSVV